MAYEYFYPGTPYSLEPEYGELFTGYRVPVSGLGLTTDPRTAAKIQEVSNKLSTGVKVIEVSAISPEIFEAIPKQHLKEINRLSKLTGVEPTVHGPLIEASGYTREGWSEANRQMSENQMKMAIERSHELSPEGNIPVTFHSTAMLPAGKEVMREKVEGEYKEVPKSILIVEPRTGEIKQLKETERFFPGEPKKFNPEEELKKRNQDMWTESVGNINFYALRGEELIKEIDRFPLRLKEEGIPQEITEKISKLQPQLFKAYAESREKPELMEKLPEKEKDILENEFRRLDHASIFLRDAYRGLRELYNMVYKEASGDDREKLDKFAKEITPIVISEKKVPIEMDKEKLKKFGEVIQDGIKVLNSIKTPKIFKPLNEFVIEKSSETFGNAAFSAYKKFKDNAPILSIENPPIGGGLARAEEIKKLIEKSREQFVRQAVKEGVSEAEAKNASEKLIGATWDVGHINMLRKYGFESKDIVKEAEKIAPFVKHVHLSDNFGFEHTELPMGMGNVPIKEIMEKLGKEGFDAKKIIEAGSWWQHMKTAPVTPTLEAFGSPLYAMKAPYWNQIVSAYGNYFGFPSAYFPEQHFSMYGSSFSTLPVELGGQMPGKQRMTGTPME